MTDERDPLIERAVRELSALPPVNPAATARILAAVEAREEGVLSIEQWGDERRRTARRYSLGALAGLAAAAAIAGFAVGFEWRPSGSESGPQFVDVPIAAAPATGVPGAQVQQASLSDDAPVITPFVLRAPGAARVSLVGDFNDWDVSKSPMRQESAAGVWSIAIPVTPGRHVYAFVVNDSVWTLDPRAPRADDPDFGRAGSVVVVGAR